MFNCKIYLLVPSIYRHQTSMYYEIFYTFIFFIFYFEIMKSSILDSKIILYFFYGFFCHPLMLQRSLKLVEFLLLTCGLKVYLSVVEFLDFRGTFVGEFTCNLGIFTFLIAELNAAAIMTIEMAHDRFRGLLSWNVLEQCTMCSNRL